MFFLFQLLLLPLPPPLPKHSPSQIFCVSICPRIFVLGKEQAETMQSGGRKVCVPQSLGVLLLPFHAFEVFPRPIMHLEVVWREAEEHSLRGDVRCGSDWCVGKCVFGAMLMVFSSCASSYGACFVLGFLAPPSCLHMEMRARSRVTQTPLFWLPPSSVTDKESVSHTHTDSMCVFTHVKCFHRWMISFFIFLALIVPVRIPDLADVFVCFFSFSILQVDDAFTWGHTSLS